MLDPLGVITKTRTAIDEETDLADAPSTITQREELQRQQNESFFYMPDIGEVPEITVPDFLPNLLGTGYIMNSELCFSHVNLLSATCICKYKLHVLSNLPLRTLPIYGAHVFKGQ